MICFNLIDRWLYTLTFSLCFCILNRNYYFFFLVILQVLCVIKFNLRLILNLWQNFKKFTIFFFFEDWNQFWSLFHLSSQCLYFLISVILKIVKIIKYISYRIIIIRQFILNFNKAIIGSFYCHDWLIEI